MRNLVGLGRFELPTSCTPSKRASQAALQPETSLAYTVLQLCLQLSYGSLQSVQFREQLRLRLIVGIGLPPLYEKAAPCFQCAVRYFFEFIETLPVNDGQQLRFRQKFFGHALFVELTVSDQARR